MTDDDAPGDSPGEVVTLLTALMEVVDKLSTLIDATKSYRERCLVAGLPPVLADRMAGDLHRHLINNAFNQLGG
jgi:hypothetical protein